MRSLLSIAGLARASALHPWRVIGIWILILVLAGISGSSLGDVLTTEANLTTNPDSVRGANLLEDRLRGPDPVTETVIVQSEAFTVDDADFRARVEETTTGLLALEGFVESATNYYENENEGLVSEDRQTTLIPVTLAVEFDDAVDGIHNFIDIVHEQDGDGFLVITVGDASASETFNTMAEEDLLRGEVIGILVAAVILIIVFGALVAAGVPIILAIVAIFVAVGLTALVGRLFELSFFVQNIITMLGLAVGIDYSLFIIERYREERRHGVHQLEAITIAGGTATKAVVFSAGAVIFALLGMFFVPVSIFRSLGAGAVLVVVSAVAATLTLIPAVLGLLGDRIEWPRKRNYPEFVVTALDPDEGASYRGFWGQVTHVVMARPVISAVLAGGFLLLLALPVLDLNTGQAGIETLPESDTRTGFNILSEEFSAGLLQPVEIVVDGTADSSEIQAGISALVADLEANPDYVDVADTEWNEAGDLALVSAFLATDANDPAAYDEIARLRDEAVPDSFGSNASRVFVTGTTAFNQDFFDAVEDVTPMVFTFVLGLSFVLLLLAFRSLIVPLTAIIMNLLSVGAAYGLLVLVFQKGYGNEIFGFQQVSTIEAWLPIFLFTILFGLSMDYQVFLLSRVREHYDLTSRNSDSVAHGLQTTAKIITGAAVIMVAVFAGFAAGRLVAMQQMGFGLAVAVFMDATIVRSVLVPSTMAIIGNRNWWFPNWLSWLPDLREAPRRAESNFP